MAPIKSSLILFLFLKWEISELFNWFLFAKKQHGENVICELSVLKLVKHFYLERVCEDDMCNIPNFGWKDQ